MASLSLSPVPREFVFHGQKLPDPNPALTPEQVIELLTPAYPELSTATMTGPDAQGGKMVYTFSRALGTKG